MYDKRAANISDGTTKAGSKRFVREHWNNSFFIYRSRWFSGRSTLSALKLLNMPKNGRFQSCQNIYTYVYNMLNTTAPIHFNKLTRFTLLNITFQPHKNIS